MKNTRQVPKTTKKKELFKLYVIVAQDQEEIEQSN